MKTNRITEEEFVERVIDKELEMVKAPIRFKDISGENKNNYPRWFDHFKFESKDQEKEWEKYWMEQAKLIKGWSHKSKSQLKRDYGWFALNYGLSVKRDDDEKEA